MEESLGNSKETSASTMQLWNLPDDILIIIFDYLDAPTLYNLYNTCKNLRNVIYNVKHCTFSMNSMATEKSLRLAFFKDIVNNLVRLDMKAVTNLTAASFIPVLKTLSSLRSLDVSYTSITMLDLVTLPELCPAVKDITLNYDFGDDAELSPKVISQCQSLFQHFDNISFVGAHVHLLESKLPYDLLSKAKLNNLTYIIPDFFKRTLDIEREDNEKEEAVTLPCINNFFIYSTNYYNKEHGYFNLACYPVVLSLVDNANYEILVILKGAVNVRTVYASPIFVGFLKEQFNIEAKCIKTCRDLSNNSAILAWGKATNNFNQHFFNKLKSHLIQYVPGCIETSGKVASKECDSYYTTIKDHIVTKGENSHGYCRFMNRKVTEIEIPNTLLDYDEFFKEKRHVRLEIDFSLRYNRNPFTMSPNSDYLKKLTFLSLNSPYIASEGQEDIDFYDILFRCCVNLVTLNVDDSGTCLSVPLISKAIPQSNSIKNLKISQCNIDFESLFDALSKCRQMENVHIVSEESEREESDNETTITDPGVMFEKCPKLYNMYMVAPISEESCQKTIQIFKDALKKNKRSIRISLTKNQGQSFDYCPTMDVFRLSSIIRPTYLH